MDTAFGFITIGFIGLLGAMSPGPDFVVVVKNSLLSSRRAGFFTALGVGLGMLVHVAYTLVGIGFIVSQSILLFSIIKYAGAAYLIYLGIALLRTKKSDKQILAVRVLGERKKIPARQALGNGFLTNVLNPKVTVFFLSIFTQVVGVATPFFVQAAYGIEVATIVFVWFAVLAYLLTITHIRAAFSRFHHHISKIMGGLLVAIGIKVALETR